MSSHDGFGPFRRRKYAGDAKNIYIWNFKYARAMGDPADSARRQRLPTRAVVLLGPPAISVYFLGGIYFAMRSYFPSKRRHYICTEMALIPEREIWAPFVVAPRGGYRSRIYLL